MLLGTSGVSDIHTSTVVKFLTKVLQKPAPAVDQHGFLAFFGHINNKE